MTADLVWKALLLGILNAAPIGPVGLMCLRKNVEPHRLPGILAALGMAIAYAVISFCVLFGLHQIGSWLEEYRVVLQFVAGGCLVAMGWRGLRRGTRAPRKKVCPRSLAGDFTQSFAMTLLNPVPFATFAFILASFHVVRGKLDVTADLVFAALVFVGTMLFWLTANQTLHWIRNGAGDRPGKWITQVSSFALIVLGAVMLFKGAIEQSHL
ncbi:MAG: LysE family transporter [Verrucomicrobiota bacterium]